MNPGVRHEMARCARWQVVVRGPRAAWQWGVIEWPGDRVGWGVRACVTVGGGQRWRALVWMGSEEVGWHAASASSRLVLGCFRRHVAFRRRFHQHCKDSFISFQLFKEHLATLFTFGGSRSDQGLQTLLQATFFRLLARCDCRDRDVLRRGRGVYALPLTSTHSHPKYAPHSVHMDVRGLHTIVHTHTKARTATTPTPPCSSALNSFCSASRATCGGA